MSTANTCKKCKGTGRIDRFHYVDNGICYKCEGSGLIEDNGFSMLPVQVRNVNLKNLAKNLVRSLCKNPMISKVEQLKEAINLRGGSIQVKSSKWFEAFDLKRCLEVGEEASICEVIEDCIAMHNLKIERTKEDCFKITFAGSKAIEMICFESGNERIYYYASGNDYCKGIKTYRA